MASSGTDAPSLSPSASGSVSTLPLSAAASLLAASASDNGSGGPSEDSGGLSAKLEALRKQQPSWLISAARLVLEQRPDGRLVLLGRGSYGGRGRGGGCSRNEQVWALRRGCPQSQRCVQTFCCAFAEHHFCSYPVA